SWGQIEAGDKTLVQVAFFASLHASIIGRRRRRRREENLLAAADTCADVSIIRGSLAACRVGREVHAAEGFLTDHQ
ncbi:unnamed protein product, partial [Musa acuminata subsp. burmannicoides]